MAVVFDEGVQIVDEVVLVPDGGDVVEEPDIDPEVVLHGPFGVVLLGFVLPGVVVVVPLGLVVIVPLGYVVFGVVVVVPLGLVVLGEVVLDGVVVGDVACVLGVAVPGVGVAVCGVGDAVCGIGEDVCGVGLAVDCANNVPTQKSKIVQSAILIFM